MRKNNYPLHNVIIQMWKAKEIKLSSIRDLLLKQKNSKINERDQKGFTPLHYAFMCTQDSKIKPSETRALIEILLENKADLTIKDLKQQGFPWQYCFIYDLNKYRDLICATSFTQEFLTAFHAHCKEAMKNLATYENLNQVPEGRIFWVGKHFLRKAGNFIYMGYQATGQSDIKFSEQRKFTVSFDRKDIDKGWGVIKDILIHHQVKSKIIKKGVKLTDEQEGKVVTVYIHVKGSHKDLSKFINEVEQGLHKNKISVCNNLPTLNKRIKGSKYITYRQDYWPEKYFKPEIRKKIIKQFLKDIYANKSPHKNYVNRGTYEINVFIVNCLKDQSKKAQSSIAINKLFKKMKTTSYNSFEDFCKENRKVLETLLDTIIKLKLIYPDNYLPAELVKAAIFVLKQEGVKMRSPYNPFNREDPFSEITISLPEEHEEEQEGEQVSDNKGVGQSLILK